MTEAGRSSQTRSRTVLWLCRVPLILCALIFTSVSLRFVFQTVSNGARLGMVPLASNPTLGIVSIRVGYGIYPLALVIVSVYSLLTARLREGLSFVAIMMTFLGIVRIVNGLNGGAMAENPSILIGSGIVLALSVVGLLLQSRFNPSDDGRQRTTE